MKLARRASHVATACLATLAATAFLSGSAGAIPRTCSSPARLVTVAIPSNGSIGSQWLSYPGPPRANVLLPACYSPSQRYPLLVLLNGLNENYDSYAQAGLTALLHGLDAIVVMPEGGSGWYADWWNNGARGDPSWESYELDDVLPYILAHYPILPERRYHAIAGFSMGGLGATYLGGRLPGFFGSVATLSGFVDLNGTNVGPLSFSAVVDLGVGLASQGLASQAPVEDGYGLFPVYGPPNGFYFDGHNPASLVMNLEQTRVFESTGDGVPSSAGLADPTDGGVYAIPEGSVLEASIIYPMNQAYHAALTAAGVAVTYQVHPGGHDWPDFMNEFKAMLAWGLFKPVPTNPNNWVNDTVATSGQLWDISYRFDRPPTEVVQFRRSGSSLSLSGAGSGVTITTSRGCAIHTSTPATIQISSGSCR